MASPKSHLVSQTQSFIPQADNPPIGSVTASYYVSMDDLLWSNLADPLDKSAQLLWFTSIEERVSTGNVTSDFQASATIIHSLLELHIQTDSSMPTLRQALRNNNNVAQIKVTRVGHIGEGAENTEIYSTTYTNCKVESIEEFADKLIIKTRVTTRSDTAASTDFTGTQGTPSGNTSSGWDYTTNTAMS
jgi:type VI protein secretion system component Hcp